MTEKRRYRRRSLMYKVIYSNAEDPQKETGTISTDISLGGIGLRMKKFVKGMRNLNFQIYGPHSRIPIKAKGRLVWQNRLRGRAGIQFTDIGWNKIKSLV
ncbi:MAG: PilZ domain-containing protein [Candidatus Omnitrophica bacterium]|nr:PilZ domain-containing protein [Candidatus Omnitrophota bacterium]